MAKKPRRLPRKKLKKRQKLLKGNANKKKRLKRPNKKRKIAKRPS
jgi:hypothetical protein